MKKPTQVKNLISNVFAFTLDRFPNELKKARKDYEFRWNEKTEIPDKNAIFMDIIAWFIFDRELEKVEKTPLRFYYEEKADDLSKQERETLESLLRSRKSIFEVLGRKGKQYMIRDIIFKEEVYVRTFDMPAKLKRGSIIRARIIPLSSSKWGFYGGIEDCDRKLKHVLESRLKKMRKINREMGECFVEYFGSKDVEFEDMRKAMDTVEKFMGWYNDKKVEELKLKSAKPIPKSKWRGIKRLLTPKFERVGVVFTDAGTEFVPYYGFLKDIFTGKDKNISESEDVIKNAIENEGYVSNSLIKRLVEENKENAVTIFKQLYDVNNFDDVMSVLRKFRPHVDLKAIPRISLISKNESAEWKPNDT